MYFYSDIEETFLKIPNLSYFSMPWSPESKPHVSEQFKNKLKVQ